TAEAAGLEELAWKISACSAISAVVRRRNGNDSSKTPTLAARGRRCCLDWRGLRNCRILTPRVAEHLQRISIARHHPSSPPGEIAQHPAEPPRIGRAVCGR